MATNMYSYIKSKTYMYPKLEMFLVNSYYSLSEFLDLNTMGAIFCPFHDDRSGGKPSAKFYIDDDDGIEKIWCFSERKMFYAWHYIKLILRQDPLLMLVRDFSEQELMTAISDYINDLGTSQMRKSKLDDEEIKKLNSNDFISLICLGKY